MTGRMKMFIEIKKHNRKRFCSLLSERDFVDAKIFYKRHLSSFNNRDAKSVNKVGVFL